MLPRNNILAFTAALIISVQASPTNIGWSSFVYKPDSIPQNERILQLFLRLASHTANQLIYLKREANLHKASIPDLKAVVPKVRIPLPDIRPSQRISGNIYYGPSKRRRYSYGKISRMEQFRRSNNDQDVIKGNELNGNPSLQAPIVRQASESSIDTHDPHAKLQEELEKSLQGNRTDDYDIQVESRMLMNIEKNNNVTHCIDNSSNTNNVDTEVNNITELNQQNADIFQPGATMDNQNASTSGFDRYHRDNISSRQESGTLGVVSAAQNMTSMISNARKTGIVGPAINAIFRMKSESLEIVNPAQSLVSGVQSAAMDAEISLDTQTAASDVQPPSLGTHSTAIPEDSQQSETTASKVQPMLSRIISLAHERTVNPQSPPLDAEISLETQTAAAKVQIALSGMIDSAHDITADTISTATAVENSQRSETAVSKLQSTSSGIIGLAQGTAANTQSPSVATEILLQTQTAVSQLQTELSGTIDSPQGITGVTISATAITEDSQQSESTASKRQSVSSGIIGLTQSVAANAQSSSMNAEISTQSETASSELQSALSRTTDSTQGKTTETIRTIAIAENSQPDIAASKLQSASSGIIGLVQGIGVNAPSPCVDTKISLQTQTAAPKLQSSSSDTIDSAQAVAAETMSTTTIAEDSQQSEIAASKLQFVPSGIIGLAQHVAANIQSPSVVAEISLQTQTEASKLQTALSGTIGLVKAVTVEIMSATAIAEKFEPEIAASKLQSVSSGIIGSAQGIGLNAESQCVDNEISLQTQTAAPKLQSALSGTIDSAQAVTAETISTTTIAEGSQQSEAAASKLHSAPSGIIGFTESVAPNAQSATMDAEISLQTQTAAAKLQSALSSTANSAQIMTSATVTAESSQQSTTAVSKLQSLSSGIINLEQGVAVNAHSATANTEISQQIRTATSKLQSEPPEIMNLAQSVVAKVQIASANAEISQQTTNPVVFEVQSVPSAIIGSLQRVAAEVQRTNADAEVSMQTKPLASELQNASSGMIASVENISAVTQKVNSITNDDQANYSVAGFAENQRQQSSGKLGLFNVLDQNKSGGILSNTDPGENASLNRTRASITAKVISGMTSNMAQNAQTSDSKFIQRIDKSITSAALSSTGQVSKLLRDLTGTRPKLSEALVLKSESGSSTAFQTSFQRGGTSSTLTKSNGVSRVGSSLIPSFSLFRSLPDMYDKSYIRFDSHITDLKSNQSELTDDQNSFNQRITDNQSRNTKEDPPLVVYDEYGKDEDASDYRVSDSELKEYAHQLADALRPMELV